MLSLLHNRVMTEISNTFREYGLEISVQFNPDIDSFYMYTPSLNTRDIFKNVDLLNIAKEEFDKMQKESYNLLLYNREALHKDPTKLNNIRTEAYHITNKLLEFEKKVFEVSGSEIVHNEYNRKIIDDNPPQVFIRDVIAGVQVYNCKVLSYSTEIIDNIQFLYLSKFYPTKKLVVDIYFDDQLELSLKYTLNFSEIVDYNYPDYQKYGNLQQIVFNVTWRVL